ncbi:hypothetical protein CFL01nite_12780 [Corynebacterium flavescens]|uniref:Uncharacterized protein n=1 Tax=Corynebacterium flavescens TaxID=28028 RepID=A0A1L7CNE9_CORFL|nr:hypothetical protein CFLV_09390 [Corynebacterium flavescens]GEB97783.1 hypothetical protein CFL01nite_12780 [Corynebacterium flavescens]
MLVRINGKEPASLFVGAREVQRAVLAGKTVYELMRSITLQGQGFKVWGSIPTNALCYPVGTGENRGVAFKYPVTCPKAVFEWNADGTGAVIISAGTVIPAGKAVWPSSGRPHPYIFTRV